MVHINYRGFGSSAGTQIRTVPSTVSLWHVTVTTREKEGFTGQDIFLLVSPEPEQVAGLSVSLAESWTCLVHLERLDSAPKKEQRFVGLVAKWHPSPPWQVAPRGCAQSLAWPRSLRGGEMREQSWGLWLYLSSAERNSQGSRATAGWLLGEKGTQK